MSLILNIDTATGSASVCIAKNGTALQFESNPDQKDHASWLHTSVVDFLQKEQLSISDLDAVAVTIGPGSYTGLRVGLAAAKGLCYAANIPLIAIDTLEMIAFAVQDEAEKMDFICPMIDARRMEVFAAVYDSSLKLISTTHARVIDKNSFAEFTASGKTLFCGNGILKFIPIAEAGTAYFSMTNSDSRDLAILSHIRFQDKKFADLAYTEPLYVKDFYTLPSKPAI
jgi:tRNA threonylcarbamoyladenosine biosynthesis protein TsaB